MQRRSFLAGGGMAAVFPSIAFAETGAALAGDRYALGAQEFHRADIIAPSAFSLKGDAEPYFAEARAALNGILGRQAPEIVRRHSHTRWGAMVVIARMPGADMTLQEQVVLAGAARVSPQTDDDALLKKLYALEGEARRSRKGLWALNDYQVFASDDAERSVGGFSLIEGAPVKTALTRSRFYLNFGEDYQRDFTASVRAPLYRRWAEDGFALADYQGARMRIRGFVEYINGPSIDLTHPRQVELLQF